jgi:hypothetical protein
MTYPILAFTCALLASTAAFAGAWTLERGQGKAFVTSTFTYGDHGFDGDGNLIPVPEYRKFELTTSLEYGFRDWLTFLARADLTEERVHDPDPRAVVVSTSRSFGAVAGGARARLWQTDRFVASTELLALSGGMDSAGTLNPADGPGMEGRLRFGIGESVIGRPVFADVAAGYRYRFDENESDEVLVDVTLGARIRPRWLVLGQTFSTFETDGDSAFHKVAGSVVWNMRDRFHIEAGAIATVAGQNAVRELGGRLGFWYEFGGPSPYAPR